MPRFPPPSTFTGLGFSNWPYDTGRTPWFPISTDPEQTDHFNIKLASTAPLDLFSDAMVQNLFTNFNLGEFIVQSSADAYYQDALYEALPTDFVGTTTGGNANGITIRYPPGVVLPLAVGDGDRHIAILEGNNSVQFGGTISPFPGVGGLLQASFTGQTDFSLGSMNQGTRLGGRGGGTSQFSGTITPEDLKHFIDTADVNGIGEARHALMWQVPGGTTTAENYATAAVDGIGRTFYSPTTITDAPVIVDDARPRYGMRIRLKSTVDLSPLYNTSTYTNGVTVYNLVTNPGYKKLLLFLAVTLRDFGMIISDRGQSQVRMAAPITWTTYLGQPNPYTALLGPYLSTGNWYGLTRTVEWRNVWNVNNVEYVDRNATRSEIAAPSVNATLLPATSFSVQAVGQNVTGTINLPPDTIRTRTRVMRRDHIPISNDPDV